jgi:hypothetical protein
LQQQQQQQRWLKTSLQIFSKYSCCVFLCSIVDSNNQQITRNLCSGRNRIESSTNCCHWWVCATRIKSNWH